jgi:hypothetical protein
MAGRFLQRLTQKTRDVASQVRPRAVSTFALPVRIGPETPVGDLSDGPPTAPARNVAAVSPRPRATDRWASSPGLRHSDRPPPAEPGGDEAREPGNTEKPRAETQQTQPAKGAPAHADDAKPRSSTFERSARHSKAAAPVETGFAKTAPSRPAFATMAPPRAISSVPPAPLVPMTWPEGAETRSATDDRPWLSELLDTDHIAAVGDPGASRFDEPKRPRAAPDEAVIQVSIGRVEVKAPRPPPAAAPPNQQNALMALKDYLRASSGGRR